MEGTSLTLYELNGLVRQSIRECLPGEYWVQAELSDVRIHTSGHCYLEFVQKDPRSANLLAKARGTVWANVFRLLKPYFKETTGQPFTSGIKVLVKVTVEFHELYGYSLIVSDIDPAYTLGDMVKRRKEILAQLEREGVLTLNKELELPVFPQRIAVISSPTAAGYGDFCDQLNRNRYGFVFYTRLFPAIMQGERVEESVLAALDSILEMRNTFDVVVIIRGGGATSDLSGFDTYMLAAACAQFPLPVITGIGHERDDTVLDMIAHTRVKTPTAAAEFLIGKLQLASALLEELENNLKKSAGNLVESEFLRLSNLMRQVPESARRKVDHAFQELTLYHHKLGYASLNRINEQRFRLDLLNQQVKDTDPANVLKRGYSITLKEGKVVTDSSLLQKGDLLQTRFRKGRTDSIVK